ncbi:MAG: hypothetical protein AAFR61_01050 [Bacteroidota bacterium]
MILSVDRLEAGVTDRLVGNRWAGTMTGWEPGVGALTGWEPGGRSCDRLEAGVTDRLVGNQGPGP